MDNFGHSTDVINYGEVSGEKPALLLIHGQMSIWEDYALVLPELSKNWHIYAIDVYGHGESSHDEPEMLRMVAAMEMIGA